MVLASLRRCIRRAGGEHSAMPPTGVRRESASRRLRAHCQPAVGEASENTSLFQTKTERCLISISVPLMAISCFLSFCLQGAVGTTDLGRSVSFAAPAPDAVQRRAPPPWRQDSSPQMTPAGVHCPFSDPFCTRFALYFDTHKHRIMCVLM